MPADIVFSLVDVISIITLIGSIAFGIFRRDLVMFVACLGLISLTQHSVSSPNLSTLSSPMLHAQPLPEDEFSPAWFASHAVNLLVPLETLIKTDIHKVRSTSLLLSLTVTLFS